MAPRLGRRDVLHAALVASVPFLSGNERRSSEGAHSMTPGIRYCLNTATIRGQKLPIEEILDIAVQAGYDGIEPWIEEIERAQGGPDGLARRLRDVPLKVESAIGFAEWIVDDPERRGRGLERLKRDMDLVARIGGTRIAAPPAGATDVAGLSVAVMAERYRAILELGSAMGVVPQLEVWGFSRTLRRLSDAVAVAIEADHRHACILADVYHLFKGGSGFAGLRLLNGRAMHVFHVNDFPANISPDAIRDADRVFPGDGVAPISTISGDLAEAGFAGALSLEVFNADYWKRPALDVAREGLRKMRAAWARGETPLR
ncbi:MAG: sugar phosphate isomerase/epimerase [Chthonomonadales bacterium]|nr:sugar phosphate isomerase/epimerase [Chthonomonadales bacterium]